MGKPVVTANKMALATHWTEIVRTAKEHAAGLYYEASVCGAVPIIRAMNDSLQANPDQFGDGHHQRHDELYFDTHGS